MGQGRKCGTGAQVSGGAEIAGLPPPPPTSPQRLHPRQGVTYGTGFEFHGLAPDILALRIFRQTNVSLVLLDV